jgi:Zn-dependent protease
MGWSITIGSVGRTAVKIHITFILFLAWIAFSAWSRGGPAAALNSTVFIVLLFVCVVLHEFGHIVDAFGKPVGLLTRKDILSAVHKHGGEEPASAFMRSGVDSIRPATPVASVFERLRGPGARRSPSLTPTAESSACSRARRWAR